MIVSVLRHTKSPVKFWFIQNFASPQFKVFFFKFHYIFFIELLFFFKTVTNK